MDNTWLDSCGFGLSISGSSLDDCEESMKGLFIAGIVIALLAILGSTSMTGSDFFWGMGTSIFYLILSISAYNLANSKTSKKK